MYLSITLAILSLNLAILALTMNINSARNRTRLSEGEKEYNKLHNLANRKNIVTLDDLIEIINRNK
jgi:hypothetical protein